MESQTNLNIQQLEKYEADLISQSYRKTESFVLNPGEYNITSCTGDEEHFGEQERYNLNWKPLTD